MIPGNPKMSPSACGEVNRAVTTENENAKGPVGAKRSRKRLPIHIHAVVAAHLRQLGRHGKAAMHLLRADRMERPARFAASENLSSHLMTNEPKSPSWYASRC